MTLRTCPGGDCDLRTDCVRWITRHEHPHAEAFPIAPWSSGAASCALASPIASMVMRATARPSSQEVADRCSSGIASRPKRAATASRASATGATARRE